jgi:U3 small nucleolar ribonucleoprotein protein IMP4
VKEYVYDENVTTPAAAEMDRDNEYFNATSTNGRSGGSTPKIVITSSRDPSSRLVQFLKEMKLTLPESQRINRGSYTMNDLQDLCHRNEVTDLLIINEHRGQPDSIILSHFPHGPTAYFSLHNVVLRHDLNNNNSINGQEDKLEKVSECIPHLVLNGFQSKVGLRVKQILQHIFPPPPPLRSKDSSKRVCTFSVLNDYISFRNHLYLLTTDGVNKRECVLNEIGPRFEMKIYKIKLGLLTQEAENEFVLRPFMRTSRKKDNL